MPPIFHPLPPVIHNIPSYESRLANSAPVISNSYIKASGDPDYNFGYEDFTVEFFATTSNNQTTQTLFEISSIEANTSNFYPIFRFLNVIESGNLNIYGVQTITPFVVTGNNFISPISFTNNNKLFANGSLLSNNEFTTYPNSVVVINNFSSGEIEIGGIQTQILGGGFTANTTHFVSVERQNGMLYLYLDGTPQSLPTFAFEAIPSCNSSNVISTTANNALLTIGANKDGLNALSGKFGDFRITKGIARHVNLTNPKTTIQSNFTDTSLGLRPQDIIVSGGSFNDSISSFSPEELLSTQIFDTLNLSVYQANIANANSTIIGFSIFKPSILTGPISSYEFNTGNGNTTQFRVPWTNLESSDASIQINGNSIAANLWNINHGTLTLANASPNNTVVITASGPTDYFVIAANSVAYLSNNLYANSSSITVNNVAPFITPIGSLRGQIFINQECITYLYIDRTHNILSGLTRGANGTGIPAVHLANSQVISACSDRNIQNLVGFDPGISIWYSSQTNNSSLQNTATTISNLLVFAGTVPPSTPF